MGDVRSESGSADVRNNALAVVVVDLLPKISLR